MRCPISRCTFGLQLLGVLLILLGNRPRSSAQSPAPTIAPIFPNIHEAQTARPEYDGGWRPALLVTNDAPVLDGAAPVGTDLADDGRLFGCTARGGVNDQGTVFAGDVSLGDVRVLLHFGNHVNTLGFQPPVSVILAPDGRLYGVTLLGGKANKGTVFSVSTNGSDPQVVHTFTGIGRDGAFPASRLLLHSDGRLYGVTRGGNDQSLGTLFSFALGGSDFRTDLTYVSRVPGVSGLEVPALFEDSDGAIAGMKDSFGGAWRIRRGATTPESFNPVGSSGQIFALASSGDTNGLIAYAQVPVGRSSEFRLIHLRAGVEVNHRTLTDNAHRRIFATQDRIVVIQHTTLVLDGGYAPRFAHRLVRLDFAPDLTLVSSNLLADSINGAFTGSDRMRDAISPDGSFVVLIGGEDHGGLQVLPATDPARIRIHRFEGSRLDLGAPQVAHAVGRKILFSTKTTSGSDVLRDYDLDSGRVRRRASVGRFQILGTNAIVYSANRTTIDLLDLTTGLSHVIHHFPEPTTALVLPSSLLYSAARDTIYGSYRVEDTRQQPAVFAVRPDGSEFRILGPVGVGGLVATDDGALLAVEENPGSTEHLVRIELDGSGTTTLRDAEGANGPLVRVSDGYFYGNSPEGLFRLRSDGTEFTWVARHTQLGPNMQGIVSEITETPWGTLYLGMYARAERGGADFTRYGMAAESVASFQTDAYAPVFVDPYTVVGFARDRSNPRQFTPGYALARWDHPKIQLGLRRNDRTLLPDAVTVSKAMPMWVSRFRLVSTDRLDQPVRDWRFEATVPAGTIPGFQPIEPRDEPHRFYAATPP